MKYLSIIIVASCSFQLAFGQTFQKAFTKSADQIIYSGDETSDLGHIVAGTDELGGLGSDDGMVIKLDASSNIEWAKAYGGSDFDEIHSVRQVQDGGYLVCGSTLSFGAGNSDCYVIKLDANGNVDWSRVVGGAGYDRAYAGIPVTGGGYVITGYETSSSSLGKVFVFKLDASGNLVWSNTYGGSAQDGGTAIIEATDGGFLIGGNARSGSAGENDIYLLKIDANGNHQWDKLYGGSDHDYLVRSDRCMMQTQDGGYIVAGLTYSFGPGFMDIAVLRLNQNGDTVWCKTYGGASDDYTRCLIPTNDGNFMIAGYTDSEGAGQNDMLLMKIDNNGSILWQKVYGDFQSEFNYTAFQANNGDFLIPGNSRSVNTGQYEILMLKTDSAGNNGCNEMISNLQVGSAPFTIASNNTTGTFSTTQSITSSSTDITLGEEILCYYCFDLSFSTLNASEQSSCDGELTANPSGGQSPYSYQWDVNAGSQTTQTATGLCVGSYYVTITDNSGCTTIASAEVDYNVGLNETDGLSDVLVYPNPANNIIWVQHNSNNPVALLLQNIEGKTVLRGRIKTKRQALDVSALPKGIYFMQITTQHGIQTKKIVLTE